MISKLEEFEEHKVCVTIIPSAISRVLFLGHRSGEGEVWRVRRCRNMASQLLSNLRHHNNASGLKAVVINSESCLRQKFWMMCTGAAYPLQTWTSHHPYMNTNLQLWMKFVSTSATKSCLLTTCFAIVKAVEIFPLPSSTSSGTNTALSDIIPSVFSMLPVIQKQPIAKNATAMHVHWNAKKFWKKKLLSVSVKVRNQWHFQEWK